MIILLILVIAEVTTIMRATKFCQDLGHLQVELEGYAIQVVQAFQKDDMNWSRYEHLIEEDRGIIRSYNSGRSLMLDIFKMR